MLATISLTLNHSGHYIVEKMMKSPLTTLLLCLIPAHLAMFRYTPLHPHENDQRSWRRWIVVLPITGFVMTLVCFLPGIYASAYLVERARLIPQFVFVCTAIGFAFFVGLEIATRIATKQRISRWASFAWSC